MAAALIIFIFSNVLPKRWTLFLFDVIIFFVGFLLLVENVIKKEGV